MSCENSSKSGCVPIVSDKCVIYTGEEIVWLGICTGDSISTVLAEIIAKLEDYSKGEGIELSDITGNCTFVTDSLKNKDKNLSTLIQLLFDNQCTLKDFIDSVEAKLPTPFVFDIKCLDVSSNDTNSILQATIDKTCENSTNIQNIISELGDTSTLLSNIENIVSQKIQDMLGSCQGGITKSSSSVMINAQVPIGGYIFGEFPASYFDSTGLGLAAYGLCGYALANGNNGTQDLRGWSIGGATNMPGPSLLSQVNPGSDIDLVTNVGSRKGEYKHALTELENGTHNHDITVNEEEHRHGMFTDATSYNAKKVSERITGTPTSTVAAGSPDDNNLDYFMMRNGGEARFGISGPAKTNIEVISSSSGLGQKHENRPPTFYATFIKRIS